MAHITCVLCKQLIAALNTVPGQCMIMTAQNLLTNVFEGLRERIKYVPQL